MSNAIQPIGTTRKSRFLNRLRFIFDSKLTIGNLAQKVCDAHPDAILFSLDFDFGYANIGRDVSSRDFLGFANHFRNILETEFHLNRYDRVAILKRNSPEYFFCGYSVMASGGIAVPVNGGMNNENVVHYLNYTGSRFLITDVATFLRLEPCLAQIKTLEGIIIADNVPLENHTLSLPLKVLQLRDLFKSVPSRSFAPIPMNPDDMCIICHTSGTTGFPKGVVHTCSTLVAGLKRQLVAEPITSKDRALSASPFNHFINYTGLMSSMLANIQTWLVTQDAADKILSLIDRVRITAVFCFPHTYLAIYQRGLQGFALDSVRLWLSGADSSHEAHIAPFLQKGAFLRLFGKILVPSLYVDTYGSSEVGFAALFRFANRNSGLFGRYIGKPNIVGPKIKVVDEHGKQMPAGQPGRMVVKGPTVFKGYWNDMQKTQETVQDGWLWPGDIGYCDSKGRYFHLDRANDMIHKEGGEVYTLVIEEVILNREQILEAVVVAKSTIDGNRPAGSSSGNDLIAAFIQLVDPTMNSQEKSRLVADINSALPKKDQIDVFYFVEDHQIPRGLTGKVLKRVMRDRMQNGEYDSYRLRLTETDPVPATTLTHTANVY